MGISLASPLWASALSGGSTFAPGQLSPNYWWQAASGVTTPGGAVSSWDDSVALISATQGTGGARPTHSSANANWNNLPAITCDGGDYVSIDTTDLALSGQKFFHDDTTDWEIQFPYRPDSLPGTRGLVGTNNLSGNNQGFVLSKLATGGVTLGMYNGSSGNTTSLSGGTLVAGTKVVLGIRYIRSSRNFVVGVNGSYGAGITVAIAASSSDPVHSLAIGASANGVIPQFGSMPEIMILKRALSTAERADLVSFWRNKYAI